MSRLLSLAFVCVLLVGLAVSPGSVAAAADRSGPINESGDLPTQDRFTSTTFNIEVYENGSARWTFNYYTASLNDSESDQFRTFANRFESEETDLWRNFRASARTLAASGANATERNMTVSGFRRSASLNSATIDTRGRVQMSFLWTRFARVEGTDVVVGDVFEGELYIAANQWLVFETGPNLRFDPAEIDPMPDTNSSTSIADSDTITWKGERRFSDNRPRVVFSVSQSGEQPTATEGTTETAMATGMPTTSATKQAGSDGPLQLLLVGLFVLAVGIGAVVAWRSGLLDRMTAGDDGETTGDGATETNASAGPSTAAAAGESEAANDEPGVAEEELLSDEDRVVRMLETNGGRMKQANIVDETGWSKSKVSMLLSEMEDEEVISKLRVGRENIVSLSGHEPDAAGSPFDDED